LEEWWLRLDATKAATYFGSADAVSDSLRHQLKIADGEAASQILVRLHDYADPEQVSGLRRI
jgi:hypothetical protein